MRVASLALIASLTAFAVPSSGSAETGRFEIHEACATGAGCFPGDSGGYPVTILNPGSYVLTSNLSAPDLHTDVIQVNLFGRGVDVDLNGFRIGGPPLAYRNPGTGHGVSVAPTAEANVSNGTIRGVGGSGVTGGPGTRVENVLIVGVGRSGVEGSVGYVGDATLAANVGYGLDLDAGATTAMARTVIRGNNLGSFGTDGVVVELGGNGCEDSRCDSMGRKKFYLTTEFFRAFEAPGACDEGFHMASLFEMIDPSDLVYDVGRGTVQADSGLGPPTGSLTLNLGWVRTGYSANRVGDDGRGNCEAYADPMPGFSDVGSVVSLQPFLGAARAVSPWSTSGGGPPDAECYADNRVWCVQD